MLLAAAAGPRNEAVDDDVGQNPQHDQQFGRADLLRLLHANSAAADL